jgi:cytochrome P450
MSQAASSNVPDHVPAELVWNHSFDAFTAELGDPFLAVARLHDGPGVIWATDAAYGRPGWVVTRHDLISEVFVDYEHFSAERPGMIADLLGVNLRLTPIEIDPPAHYGYRRILNPYFTPKAVKAYDAPVRNACVSLIEKFAAQGGCEFVNDFAIPFPSFVFLDLMDMPRDRLADFIAWEEAVMRATDPTKRVAAARSIYHYLDAHMQAQRKKPSSEFLRAMTTAAIDGRPLEHLEVMGMFYVLYVGGLDTVYSTLGWVMRHLATHPELQQRLRDNPDDLPAAVEEFCRAFSVVVTHRQVAQDYVFHGVPMRKGEEINLPITLADRDPLLFPNPQAASHQLRDRHTLLPRRALGQARAAHRDRGVPEALPEHPHQERRQLPLSHRADLRRRIPTAGLGPGKLVAAAAAAAAALSAGADSC